jgi:methyltransferase family protein
VIVESNLPRVRALALQVETVLDVGGWHRPFHAATHVLDLQPYETRNTREALDPQQAPRYDATTWVRHDACKAPWPFPDKFFAFSFCSHLLEDVRDPLAVCAELCRVSRAGYIETPSRAREIFSKARFFGLKSLLGRMPEVGFYHHRWFVEIEGDHVRFCAKDQRLLMSRSRFITRRDLGRKMTEHESGTFLFWRDRFTWEERFDVDAAELESFRRRTLDALRRASVASRTGG